MRSFVILSILFIVALCNDSIAVCIDGACCNNGQFMPTGTVCSRSLNPCEINSVCDGYTAICPTIQKKPDGTTCMSTGKCLDGICHVPSCTGLCCKDTMVVENGTKCGAEGTCIDGTCVVVQGSLKKSKEEQQVIDMVRGVIDKDIEELLQAHEKYVLHQNKLGAKGYTLDTAVSRIQDLLSNYTAKFNDYNVVSILASKLGAKDVNSDSEGSLSWVGYLCAGLGIGLIVLIAVFVFAG